MDYASILLAFFLAIGSPLPGKAITCTDAWINIPGENARCYIFNQQLGDPARTHAQAANYCKSKGGRLASVGNKPATEADPLIKYIRSNRFPAAWLGAYYRIEDGYFRWLDGKILAKESNLWNFGEPSGNEVCVEITNKYYLNDETCSEKRNFVCEKN